MVGVPFVGPGTTDFPVACWCMYLKGSSLLGAFGGGNDLVDRLVASMLDLKEPLAYWVSRRINLGRCKVCPRGSRTMRSAGEDL